MMDIRSKICHGVLLLLGTASVLTSGTVARADDYDQPNTYQPFAIDFNEAMTRNSGDSFKVQSFGGQFSTYFGISYPWPGTLNAFPESLIADDAKRVNRVYTEALLRQLYSGPIIRTPDLINPFNSSILNQPALLD